MPIESPSPDIRGYQQISYMVSAPRTWTDDGLSSISMLELGLENKMKGGGLKYFD